MRRGSPLIPLLMASLLGLLSVSMPVPTEAHEGHPEKGLFEWRWFHESSRDPTEYLRLSTHHHYEDSDYESDWSDVIDDSISAWSSTSSAVVLDDSVTPSDYNDVHIAITDSNGIDHWGTSWSTLGLKGIAYILDASKDYCLDGCSTAYYALVMVDETSFFFWNDATDRKAALVHELGHALTLTHEPTPDTGTDGDCGNTVPGSVMDYDCVADEADYNSPTDWDVCGLNHAYYHQSWGYAGCDTDS